jgi:hypothetical protein
MAATSQLATRAPLPRCHQCSEIEAAQPRTEYSLFKTSVRRVVEGLMMKRSLQPILLLLLVAGNLSHAQSSPSAADHLLPLLKEQMLAANAHDTDRFLATYRHNDDLLFVANGRSSAVGRNCAPISPSGGTMARATSSTQKGPPRNSPRLARRLHSLPSSWPPIALCRTAQAKTASCRDKCLATAAGRMEGHLLSRILDTVVVFGN